jgi:hypothetical protein
MVLLANQIILIHNLQNSEKLTLLTEEAVELLTSPLDLVDYCHPYCSGRCEGEGPQSIPTGYAHRDRLPKSASPFAHSLPFRWLFLRKEMTTRRRLGSVACRGSGKGYLIYSYCIIS